MGNWRSINTTLIKNFVTIFKSPSSLQTMKKRMGVHEIPYFISYRTTTIFFISVFCPLTNALLESPIDEANSRVDCPLSFHSSTLANIANDFDVFMLPLFCRKGKPGRAIGKDGVGRADTLHRIIRCKFHVFPGSTGK